MSTLFDLTADVFLIIGELATELFRDLYDSICIINNVYLSENDHAFYVQCPFTLVAIAIVIDAEGDLIILLKRFQPMADLAAMDDELNQHEIDNGDLDGLTIEGEDVDAEDEDEETYYPDSEDTDDVDSFGGDYDNE